MGNFRIILRTNYVSKDGKKPLAVKYTESGKIFQANINVCVDAENWNPDKQAILSKEENFEIKNLYVRNAKAKAESIMLNYEVSGKKLTVNEFKKEFSFKESTEDSNCFYQFAENEIAFKKMSIEKSTHYQYKAEMNKMKQFRSKVSLEEVNNYTFFQQYEYYMRNSLNNKTNTVGKTLKKIKALLQIAYKKGLIKQINTTSYRLKYEKVNREFLSVSELKKLEDLIRGNIPDTIKDSLKCFLFSCYTGLRYLDLYNLKYSDISDGFIDIIQDKTNEQLKIPLSTKALSLINENMIGCDKKVFKVYSNQKINDYLKVGMFYAGIKKKLSFHCSRHTFATISLNLNIPLNVVSKFLGHNDLKTTQIYAKLLEETKVAEMKKWDGI